MSARLQLRGDTLANWLKYDPVLMEREVVLIASNPGKPKVYDLKKIGDGTHKFSELPMLGDLDNNYEYRFVQNSQIAPYVKEMYIHGKGIEGKVLSFTQFFNNNRLENPKNNLGLTVVDEEGNTIFYLDNAKDGYNKVFYHKGLSDEAILEIIADFSFVPHGWGKLISTKNRQILSAAFDLDYSPSIKINYLRNE